MDKQFSNKASAAGDSFEERRPYHSPTLTTYGTIGESTASGSEQGGEGGGVGNIGKMG